MLIADETIQSIYLLISECFKMNRKLDRQVSVLGVNFAMNNTADLCHEGIAHYFPSLSDKIAEKCLERYNIAVEYGETPSGKESYDSPLEIIDSMHESVIDFQTMFMGVIDIAYKNKDIQVFTDLLDLLKDYNNTVEQVILLKDKIHAYDDMQSFDAHIKEHFWIL